MLDREIREQIAKISEEAVLFGGEDLVFGQAYDKSIIGLSYEERVVYDYDRMVQEYMQDNGCDVDEAIDWINYNTLRSLPYAGPNAPIVITRRFNEEEII